jgi:LCP family protein required for cell wall assembly
MRLIPHTRGGALWRFALAAVLVIVFAAATTAVAGLLQFKQFAHDLAATPALKSAQVTIANPGNPQTLLLIGSDHRAGTPWITSNTDTMMLVRLDPNSSTINLLSLPRDLKVNVPHHGTEKLNAAYSQGGPNLLLKTIQQNGFPQLQVNHIIDVNFGGFTKLINALGCVYTDVDHRYYNNTAQTDYSSIDIQPGYQKLCGADALAFVRFRHTDNDIVRNARQQDFVRWVKDQYSQSRLISQRDQLISIFGQNTQTDSDLHSIDGLINLFNLVAFSAGHQIKQVQFPAILLPCGPPGPGASPAVQQTPCYVTANPGALGATYHAFITPTVPKPAAATPASGTNPGGGAPAPKPGPGGPPNGLTADLGDGLGQARALGHAGMPVYVPSQIVTGSSYCAPDSLACTVADGQTPAQEGVPSGYPRAYLIHDENGNPHAAYRMTIVQNSALGEYYGVEGTTWQDPPLLNKPTKTVNVGGKQLLEYANAGKISVVAWRTPGGVYWISNTLTDSISNAQMVAIAASLTPAGH